MEIPRAKKRSGVDRAFGAAHVNFARAAAVVILRDKEQRRHFRANMSLDRSICVHWLIARVQYSMCVWNTRLWAVGGLE